MVEINTFLGLKCDYERIKYTKKIQKILLFLFPKPVDMVENYSVYAVQHVIIIA